MGYANAENEPRIVYNRFKHQRNLRQWILCSSALDRDKINEFLRFSLGPVDQNKYD